MVYISLGYMFVLLAGKGLFVTGMMMMMMMMLKIVTGYLFIQLGTAYHPTYGYLTYPVQLNSIINPFLLCPYTFLSSYFFSLQLIFYSLVSLPTDFFFLILFISQVILLTLTLIEVVSKTKCLVYSSIDWTVGKRLPCSQTRSLTTISALPPTTVNFNPPDLFLHERGPGFILCLLLKVCCHSFPSCARAMSLIAAKPGS